MSQEVLHRRWEELKKYPNVINVFAGIQVKDGKETGTPSITVFVTKKKAEADLSTYDILPKSIDGVAVDVVEVAPDGWEAGTTSVSDTHPSIKHSTGLIRKPHELPKALATGNIKTKTPSGYNDFIKWMSPVQDQGNCGSCVSFGSIGVWEGCIRIKENNASDPIKLSEAALFFCTTGCTCDTGAVVDDVLNQATKVGTCIESQLPYKDINQPCPTITKDVKIAGWNTISDATAIKSYLDTLPVVGTMDVHQSFENYLGGVYKHLSVGDPIVGGHCMGVVGYSDALNAWLVRNSWKNWGTKCEVGGGAVPGYAWVDYGELDAEMYALDVIIPVTPPSPVPVNNPGCILGLLGVKEVSMKPVQLTVSKTTIMYILVIAAAAISYIISNNLLPGYSVWLGLPVLIIGMVIDMLKTTQSVQLKSTNVMLLAANTELNKRLSSISNKS